MIFDGLPLVLLDPVPQSAFPPPLVPSLDFCSDFPISFKFDWYLEPVDKGTIVNDMNNYASVPSDT